MFVQTLLDKAVGKIDSIPSKRKYGFCPQYPKGNSCLILLDVQGSKQLNFVWEHETDFYKSYLSQFD